MKQTLILISILIFIFPPFLSFSQNLQTDWEDMHLKGKIRSITEITYKVEKVNGKIEKGYRGEWIIYRFNENGYLTENIHMDPHEGSLDYRTVFTYNTENKLLWTTTFNKDSALFIIHTFIYNDKGQLILDSISSPSGITKYIYSYNKKGEQTMLEGYDHEGKFFTKYTYEYDINGNEKKQTWYEQNGDIIYTYEYSYNKSGDLVEEVYTYYSNGGGKVKTAYTYDTNGNLIETRNNDDKDVYSLDVNSNWIKKETIENKQPLSVTEREIEYY